MNVSINSFSQPATSLGFTLIELLVTIAVLGIITSIAAPSISSQLANQRVKSTTATLTNALKEAKVESVIRRQIMTVSISADTIEIKDSNTTPNTVASYQYDVKSTIDNNDEINFRPNKTADVRTYTICDSNTAASPRQIDISSVAIITISQPPGGTC